MCDSNIHDELINLEQSTCPFCDQLLMEGDKATDSCCNEQNIENLNGSNTCMNCGSVHFYTTDNEYIDFYANLHKIKKKSQYIRFYHIENVLNKLCLDNGIVLPIKQRGRIYKIFKLIGTIIPKVNNTTRKRLISINYILKMIFIMMGLPYDHIPISKSKKTLSYYKKYWDTIMSLIGDKIQSIIDHKTGYVCYPIDA